MTHFVIPSSSMSGASCCCSLPKVSFSLRDGIFNRSILIACFDLRLLLCRNGYLRKWFYPRASFVASWTFFSSSQELPKKGQRGNLAPNPGHVLLGVSIRFRSFEFVLYVCQFERQNVSIFQSLLFAPTNWICSFSICLMGFRVTVLNCLVVL